MKNIETITVYSYNHFVINKNLEDLTNDECLIRPVKDSNNMNWILGHIVNTREAVLEHIGIEGILDNKYEEMYKQGSAKSDDKDAADVNVLLNIFNEQQNLLIEKLKDFEMNKDDMDFITGASFHEAYHAGQLGYIRKLIGKEAKI